MTPKHLSIFILIIFILTGCFKQEVYIEEEQISCDPNSPSVVEELKLIGKFEEKKFMSPTSDFVTISEDDIENYMGNKIPGEEKRKYYLYEETPIWNVCNKVVIFFEPLTPQENQENIVYYNGNLYHPLNGSIPNYHIGDKISFSQNTEDIQENDEGDLKILSERYINNSKYSLEVTGYTDGAFPITVLKKDGKEVSDSQYEYVGMPNGWDESYTEYKDQATYIVSNKAQFSWREGQQSLPTYNQDVKYKIVSNGSDLSKEYDAISDLVTINGKLGYRYKKDDKKYQVYDGKVIGKKFKSVSHIMDTGINSFAYVGKDNDSVMHIIKDGKDIFSFKTEQFTGAGIQEHSIGSVAFSDDDFAVSIVDYDLDGYGYIQYGNNKIDGIIGDLKFIDNKLVIYNHEDSKIYIQK